MTESASEASKIWYVLKKRLSGSSFRSRFHLTQKDRAYIAMCGIDTIRSQAREILRKRLAPAYPPDDGFQTPMRGHPVFIAQHAVGLCCRKCAFKWHGFEIGRALTDGEIEHAVDTVMRWITENAGDLDRFPRSQNLFEMRPPE